MNQRRLALVLFLVLAFTLASANHATLKSENDTDCGGQICKENFTCVTTPDSVKRCVRSYSLFMSIYDRNA